MNDAATVVEVALDSDATRLDAFTEDELARVLVLARTADPPDLGALLRDRRIPHWEAVAASAVVDPARLAARVRSISEGGAPPVAASIEERHDVVSREDCGRCIVAAEALVRRTGGGTGICARIGAIADELVKNALRAARGGSVVVEIGTDRARWAIVVRDRVGALTPDVALEALARGYAGGAARAGGGAGLGLYHVLGLADDLCVTCAPGRLTEVRAVVEARRGPFRRGFDAFLQPSEEPWGRTQ